MSSFPLVGLAPDLMMALTEAVVALLAKNLIVHVPDGREMDGEFGTRTETESGSDGVNTFIPVFGNWYTVVELGFRMSWTATLAVVSLIASAKMSKESAPAGTFRVTVARAVTGTLTMPKSMVCVVEEVAAGANGDAIPDVEAGAVAAVGEKIFVWVLEEEAGVVEAEGDDAGAVSCSFRKRARHPADSF